MRETNSTGDRLVCFMMGGALGALIALLLAPRSGKETRELIAHKAQEQKEAIGAGTKKRIIKSREKMAFDAKALVTRAKNISTKEKEVLLEAIEAGRKTYAEVLKSLGT